MLVHIEWYRDSVTVWIVNVPICIKSREQTPMYFLCNRFALQWPRPYDLLNHLRSAYKDGKWYIIGHDAPSDIFFHDVVPNWLWIWKLMVDTYERHLCGQITLSFFLFLFLWIWWADVFLSAMYDSTNVSRSTLLKTLPLHSSFRWKRTPCIASTWR